MTMTFNATILTVYCGHRIYVDVNYIITIEQMIRLVNGDILLIVLMFM